MAIRLITGIFLLLTIIGCDNDEESGNGMLELVSVFVGTSEINLSPGQMSEALPTDRSITLMFSTAVDASTAQQAIQLRRDQQVVQAQITTNADSRSVTIIPDGALSNNTVYTLTVTGTLKGQGGEAFIEREINFKTALASLSITSVQIATREVYGSDRVTDVPLDLSLVLHFSQPLNTTTVAEAVTLDGTGTPDLSFTFENDNKTLKITSPTPLRHLTRN